MAPLALVPNWTTRLSHLHQLQNYPPDGATCLSCKFGHQLVLLALVANLATRLRAKEEAPISIRIPTAPTFHLAAINRSESRDWKGWIDQIHFKFKSILITESQRNEEKLASHDWTLYWLWRRRFDNYQQLRDIWNDYRELSRNRDIFGIRISRCQLI